MVLSHRRNVVPDVEEALGVHTPSSWKFRHYCSVLWQLHRDPSFLFKWLSISVILFLFAWSFVYTEARDRSLSPFNDIPQLRERLIPHDIAVAQGLPDNPVHMSLYPQRSPSLREDFVFVTAVSRSFVTRALNLIGSIHMNEPHLRIIVYSLDLDAATCQMFMQLRNVYVEVFDFSAYPPHIADLGTYSFKPPLISDAVSKYGSILFLDAGEEVWRPIDDIIELIDRNGYFLTVQRTQVSLVAQGMLTALNVSIDKVKNKKQISSGIIGLKNEHLLDDPFAASVWQPWYCIC
jgi:hypothetical protein